MFPNPFVGPTETFHQKEQPTDVVDVKALREQYRLADPDDRLAMERLHGRATFLPVIPYDPAAEQWTDLGLPSGRLWASGPAEGFYTWDDAVEKFNRYLPTASAMMELIEECAVKTTDEGLVVTGPSGASIVLPYTYDNGIKRSGQYWTATAAVPKPGSESMDKANAHSARHLSFRADYVLPAGSNSRAFAMGVITARAAR